MQERPENGEQFRGSGATLDRSLRYRLPSGPFRDPSPAVPPFSSRLRLRTLALALRPAEDGRARGRPRRQLAPEKRARAIAHLPSLITRYGKMEINRYARPRNNAIVLGPVASFTFAFSGRRRVPDRNGRSIDREVVEPSLRSRSSPRYFADPRNGRASELRNCSSLAAAERTKTNGSLRSLFARDVTDVPFPSF